MIPKKACARRNSFQRSSSEPFGRRGRPGRARATMPFPEAPADCRRSFERGTGLAALRADERLPTVRSSAAEPGAGTASAPTSGSPFEKALARSRMRPGLQH
jgi:hypothetical protein